LWPPIRSSLADAAVDDVVALAADDDVAPSAAWITSSAPVGTKAFCV